MKRFFIFFFITVQACCLLAKPAEIAPDDVLSTLNQIMHAHASHKALSENLIKRAIDQFIEELDPARTYFLKSEVEVWNNLSSEELTKIKVAIEEGDFQIFFDIHQKMVDSIQRRNILEETICEEELPKNASIKELKEIDFATCEEELKNRLTLIKVLQRQGAEKLDEDAKIRAFKRIEKRRASKEEELISAGQLVEHKTIYTFILKAFANAFDSHTSYFTPSEASQFLIQVQQRLFGIGAQLRDDLNGFTVVKIIEGGPASRNTGLKQNDRIIAINKEPVVGLDIAEAVDLIRGEEGSAVFLTVLRTIGDLDEKHEIEITRGEVVIQEARIESSTIPFGEGVIAHISLHAFYQDPLHSSSADLYEEIKKISKEHSIKGLILDLRHNSGGVLPQAVAVTGLFITKGIVVSIKDNNGNIEHLREIDGRTAYDGPLIVLTSKASASAAEIVAQTLQDYGRALVVGDEHTFGKGTFQTFTLDASQSDKINPKGEFKVTRGRYYTVSGKSPQLVGVLPDILVPGLYSSLEIGERHTKYPLENDSISENYHDDLSDIPPQQRDQISWLYRFNLQSRLKTYTRYLPLLKKNSEKRMENNNFYKSFLDDIKKEEIDEDRIVIYSSNDPQFQETVNIMKDLILLKETR